MAAVTICSDSGAQEKIHAEYIMRNAGLDETQAGIKIAWRNSNNLRYGEGNGNPLQCSCLENPRDGGAWWAAACGVAQSQTRLKGLSSSSSSRTIIYITIIKPTSKYSPMQTEQ